LANMRNREHRSYSSMDRSSGYRQQVNRSAHQSKRFTYRVGLLLLLTFLFIFTFTACSDTSKTTPAVSGTSVANTTAKTSASSQSQTTTTTKASTTSTSTQGTSSQENNTSQVEGIHMRINAEAAKKIIDSNKDAIILDVRTPEENRELRIPGSTLIPLHELAGRLSELPKSEKQPILVYCRSGNRSAQAAALLKQHGFPVVYDFGGIISWPYETEKG
jgi:phage shock protein E